MRSFPSWLSSGSRIAVPLAALASLFIAVAAHAKEPRVIVGQGSHTYEWAGNWPRFPVPGMYVGSTHGDVVVDSQDRVYFSTDTSNTIYTVKPDGRVLRIWGTPFAAGAHGLRLAKDGGREVIWLTHLKRHEVVKLSLDGEVLMTLTYPRKLPVYKEAKEFTPTAVDVNANGDVYVADGYGKGWVHQWNANGEHIRSWDGSEGGAGKFNQPHGIGIDARGAEPLVVVADRQNHRLQLFTLDGKFVKEVKEDLRRPSKVVTKGADLMIVDLEGRVTIFDKDYKVVAQLGDNSVPELRGTFEVPPERWKAGEFISPHGAAWDSKGNLYVQDWNAYGRVTKLRRIKAK
jgi:streptogramin lyase